MVSLYHKLLVKEISHYVFYSGEWQQRKEYDLWTLILTGTPPCTSLLKLIFQRYTRFGCAIASTTIGQYRLQLHSKLLEQVMSFLHQQTRVKNDPQNRLVDLRNNKGETALHRASCVGKIPTLKVSNTLHRSFPIFRTLLTTKHLKQRFTVLAGLKLGSLRR